MKTATLIIMGVALALFIVGCTPADEDVTGEVIFGSPSTVIVEHTPDEVVVREYDVRLTDSGFFPSTFHVQTGETLRLVFLMDEPRFISIDGFGVAENVQKEAIELVATESGEYSLLCLDCEDVVEARIVVA